MPGDGRRGHIQNSPIRSRTALVTNLFDQYLKLARRISTHTISHGFPPWDSVHAFKLIDRRSEDLAHTVLDP